RCISTNNSLPLQSINVTAQIRTLTERSDFVVSCQQPSSSRTQGPARFPSSSKMISVGSVRVVIFNISFKGLRQFHVTKRCSMISSPSVSVSMIGSHQTQIRVQMLKPERELRRYYG